MNSPLFTGQNLIVLKETRSTNAHALDLLKRERPTEGTGIFAYHQIEGKGQHNTSWESDTGKNILVSIIYYPSFLPAIRHFLLNMSVSLAVKDFFDLHIPERVRIKWPNDLYYEERKLGGILIQNSIVSGRFRSSVIGLGLNINQEQFPLYLPNPISLSIVTQQQHNLQQLLDQLFGCLEARYLRLKKMDSDRIKEEYEQFLYKKDEEVRCIPAYEREQTGKILGVEEDGHLRMQIGDNIRYFGFKEIAFPL
ncbi:MAG: biotin--[acetyl-CoA-carboxylase] ligase [Bacteroidia bacterium]